jgi:hypothetical protein
LSAPAAARLRGGRLRSSSASATDRLLGLTIPAAVVILTILAFLPTLENGFVDWDDGDNFQFNESYRGLGWTQLKWVFTSVHMGHYIPLTWLTSGLDYVVWGNGSVRLPPDEPAPSCGQRRPLLSDRPEAAIEQYREAVRRVPTYAEAHNNLGLALAQQDRFVEAVEHYREALRLRPDYTGVHTNLGMALAKQGRTEEALQYFVDAVALRPSSAEAHNNLGLILVRAGRTEKAEAQFREALRLQPDLRDAQSNLERLIALRSKGAR